MPLIIQADETRTLQEGRGWKEVLLAGAERIGTPAMSARRWSLAPNAVGPQIEHGDYDEMVYVISGGGVAVVSAAALPLAPESVLWLEPGDRYHFEAGPEGLEILQGCAPDG